MTPVERLRKVFGNPQQPEDVTQRQFDDNQAALVRIASGNPSASDLIAYTYDLRFVDLQLNLFRWAMPFLLSQWREHVLSNHDSGLVERFNEAMGVPRFTSGKWVLEELCPPRERAHVYRFCTDVLLEKMERSTTLCSEGRIPSSWDEHWNSAGCWLPEYDYLIREWWTSDKPGHRVCVVQWVSALQYNSGDNPIYAPWTPDRGGGPPLLWQLSGLCGSCHWRAENTAALRQHLTMRAVHDALTRAVAGLSQHAECAIAQRVLDDWRPLAGRTASRIPVLIKLLESGKSLPMRWEDFEGG